MSYIPDEQERERFERYLELNGIVNEKEIQEAWNDYRNSLEDMHFNNNNN